jgi:hypothetical protein
LHQTEKLLHSKRSNKEIKGHPTDWEKIYSRHISGKWRKFKIHQELKQLNSKKTNFKMGKESEQTFLERRNMRKMLNTGKVL